MTQDKAQAAGAVSIADDNDFHKLVMAMRAAFGPNPQEPYRAMIRHIDAHAAQHYEAGKLTERERMVNHVVAWQDRTHAAEASLARLVEALTDIAQPANAGCGCHLPCRCATPEAERINAQEMREIAESALAILPAAPVSQPAAQEAVAELHIFEDEQFSLYLTGKVMPAPGDYLLYTAPPPLSASAGSLVTHVPKS